MGASAYLEKQSTGCFEALHLLFSGYFSHIPDRVFCDSPLCHFSFWAIFCHWCCGQSDCRSHNGLLGDANDPDRFLPHALWFGGGTLGTCRGRDINDPFYCALRIGIYSIRPEGWCASHIRSRCADPCVLLVFHLAAFGAERPSILFSQSGALFAINDQKYGTAASTFRSERFERERWTQLLGIQEFERLTNWKTPIFRCDGTGCVYLKNTKVITFLNNAHTIKTDCDRADILISRVPIPKGCRNPSTIVDKFSLWREGGHALYLDEKGNARLETVNSLRGDRPWVPLVYRKWLEVNR
jgi:hypothetical protein